MSRIFLFCTHLRWPVEEAGTSALEQEFLVVGDATFGELAGVLHPDKDKSTHGGYVRLFFFFSQACSQSRLLSKDKSRYDH